jgi:hypothetical protein
MSMLEILCMHVGIKEDISEKGKVELRELFEPEVIDYLI